jgi:hypothetical protein
MITYTNIEEVNKDIVNGVLNIQDDDVHFAFDAVVPADIKCESSVISFNKLTCSNIRAHKLVGEELDSGDVLVDISKVRDIKFSSVFIARKSLVYGTQTSRRKHAIFSCIDNAPEKTRPILIEIEGKKYKRRAFNEAVKDLKVQK